MFIQRRRRRTGGLIYGGAGVAGGGGGGGLPVGAANQYSGASSGATTSGIDTTGATFLIIATIIDGAAAYSGTVSDNISDSKGNTWTARTLNTVIGGGKIKIFYVDSATPTVGAGHTFSLAGSNFFGAIVAGAFANTPASPFDTEANATGTNTPANGSTVTPSANLYLDISAIGLGGAGGTTTADSIDVGTILSGVGSDTEYGIYLAYLKNGASAPAYDPSWTLGGSQTNQIWGINNATFKGT